MSGFFIGFIKIIVEIRLIIVKTRDLIIKK